MLWQESWRGHQVQFASCKQSSPRLSENTSRASRVLPWVTSAWTEASPWTKTGTSPCSEGWPGFSFSADQETARGVCT